MLHTLMGASSGVSYAGPPLVYAGDPWRTHLDLLCFSFASVKPRTWGRGSGVENPAQKSSNRCLRYYDPTSATHRTHTPPLSRLPRGDALRSAGLRPVTA